MTRNETTVAILDVVGIAAVIVFVVLTLKACTDREAKTYEELDAQTRVSPAIKLEDVYPPMGTEK